MLDFFQWGGLAPFASHHKKYMKLIIYFRMIHNALFLKIYILENLLEYPRIFIFEMNEMSVKKTFYCTVLNFSEQ